MTQAQWIDFLDFIVSTFGQAFQWLFVAGAIMLATLVFLILSLAMLRRMLIGPVGPD
jgi:hypothetical protein